MLKDSRGLIARSSGCCPALLLYANPVALTALLVGPYPPEDEAELQNHHHHHHWDHYEVDVTCRKYGIQNL